MKAKSIALLLGLAILSSNESIRGADNDPKLFLITECGPHWPQPGSVTTGFIDVAGKIVIPPTPDYITLQDRGSACFAEGLQPVTVGLKTKWPPTSWGYLDPTGKFAIEPQFEQAQPFSEGLAAVASRAGPPWGRGYIDHTGKWIIPSQFEQAGPFIGGVAVVQKSGDWLRGCIDRTGKWIIPPEYPSIGTISEGMICVGKYVTPRTAPPSGNEQAPLIWGFFDTTGKQLIDFKFKEPSSFSQGLAAINEDSQCGYIDKTGAYAIAPTYRMGWNFSEGLARVETKDGKMICIDTHGTKVFEWPPHVTWAEPFSEGLAATAIPGKGPQNRTYGFIDHSGAYVLPPQFLSAESFSNGLARVLLGEEAGYIDKTGHFVWKTNIGSIMKQLQGR